MTKIRAIRRSVAVFILLIFAIISVIVNPDLYQADYSAKQPTEQNKSGQEAAAVLETLDVKGRAPKTDYDRSQFGDGWASLNGCDTRNEILRRDLNNTVINQKCQVVSGTLADPYTAKYVDFQRGPSSSKAVQIDHVVALGDAWQKGAQQLSYQERLTLANDPLELLAVDGPANQQKSDGDAATWLPSNRSFRCQYVARQIAVKKKYDLWVTLAEKGAMQRVLSTCPDQKLPLGF